MKLYFNKLLKIFKKVLIYFIINCKNSLLKKKKIYLKKVLFRI